MPSVLQTLLNVLPALSKSGHAVEFSGSRKPIDDLLEKYANQTNEAEQGLGFWSTDNPLAASTYAMNEDGGTVTPLISRIPPEAVMTHDAGGDYFDFPGRSELIQKFLSDPKYMRLAIKNLIDLKDADELSETGAYKMDPDTLYGKIETPSTVYLTKPDAQKYLDFALKYRNGGAVYA